jgi:hypothetical protein
MAEFEQKAGSRACVVITSITSTTSNNARGEVAYVEIQLPHPFLGRLLCALGWVLAAGRVELAWHLDSIRVTTRMNGILSSDLV